MFKMPLIRNSIGSGMLLALAGTTTLIGAGYFISGLMSDNQKVITNDARIAAHIRLVDLVRRNLYEGRNCTAALGGKQINDALIAGGQGADIDLPITVGNTTALMQPGWRASSGTDIKSIKLKINNTARPEVRIHSETVDKVAAYATLTIEPDLRGLNVYKKKPSGEYVYKDLHIDLFLYYEVQGANKELFSCYGPSSEAAICTVALQGAYNADPSIDSELRCQPDLQCFNYKNGIRPAGSACPAPFVAKKVGSSMQTCSWCHPEPASIASLAFAGFGSSNELDLDLVTDDGRSVDCSSSGYSNLSDEEAYDARQTYYDSNIGNLTPEQQAQYSGCLGYQPPEPIPPEEPLVPTTSGGSGSGGSGGSSGGSGGCFVAGTPILFHNGDSVNIEDVQVGDKLVDNSGKEVVVMDLMQFDYEGEIHSINGGPYFFTSSHPFLSTSGWKSLNPEMSKKETPEIDVSRLKVGDILFKKNGIEVVMTIDSKQTRETVYNFTVSDSHVYIADDYVVHNKRAAERTQIRAH